MLITAVGDQNIVNGICQGMALFNLNTYIIRRQTAQRILRCSRFKQNRKHIAEKPAVKRVSFLQRKHTESFGPFEANFRINGIRKTDSGSTRTFRIRKCVKIGDRKIKQELKCFFKLAIGFAGKTGNDIDTDAGIGIVPA